MAMFFAPPLAFEPKAVEGRLGPEGVAKLSRLSSGQPLADFDSLAKQLSLHLPRFTPEDNLDRRIILAEAERLAQRLSDLRELYQGFLPRPPEVGLSLQQFHFGPVADEVARPILERFHYLFSFRADSLHFGLRFRPGDAWPVALVTLSPFDLGNARAGLERCGLRAAETMVVSRAFAFPGAPRNTLSFLLSRVRHALKNAPLPPRALVTYVNPNLGFSGASYKADNWSLLGTEGGTRYLYFHGNYVTDREALRRFGASFEEIADSSPASGLTRSRCELRPLLLFIRGVTTNFKAEPLHFSKWSAIGRY